MVSSNRTGKFTCHALCVLVLGAAFAPGLALAQAGRPPAEVEVVNTPDVNVVNTPGVNVANTPSVEVTNSPTVQLGANARIRDRDNPALQPVQFSCEVTLINLDQIGDQLCGEAPPGKRLVIEYIHAVARVPSGQRPNLRIGVSNEDLTGAISSLEYQFYFDECGPISGDTCHIIRQNVRLYHTQFNVLIRFNRTSPFTGEAHVAVYFSGYLVDNV